MLNNVNYNSLTFLIDEIFIKRLDYKNPIRKKTNEIYLGQILKSSNTVFKIYLETIQIKHKNNYNFGFVNYEKIKIKNYTSYVSNIREERVQII